LVRFCLFEENSEEILMGGAWRHMHSVFGAVVECYEQIKDPFGSKKHICMRLIMRVVGLLNFIVIFIFINDIVRKYLNRIRLFDLTELNFYWKYMFVYFDMMFFSLWFAIYIYTPSFYY
jgi:hypothetical protein